MSNLALNAWSHGTSKPVSGLLNCPPRSLLCMDLLWVCNFLWNLTAWGEQLPLNVEDKQHEIPFLMACKRSPAWISRIVHFFLHHCVPRTPQSDVSKRKLPAPRSLQLTRQWCLGKKTEVEEGRRRQKSRERKEMGVNQFSHVWDIQHVQDVPHGEMGRGAKQQKQSSGPLNQAICILIELSPLRTVDQSRSSRSLHHNLL